MFKFNDKIAVAVSGGKDSASLLYILAMFERKYPKAQLIAITIDEGIQGYRDEALKLAADNCRRLDIEHFVISFKELYDYTLDQIVGRLRHNGNSGLTPCAYCGVLRRKALNITARKLGVSKIATAHTLDDETQTILMNIFRSDVLRMAKVKPITDEVHPKLIQRIKPFCEIPERETALYSYIKGISFQKEPCPYASDALRNDARRMINDLEKKHPGIKFTILKFVEKIRPTLRLMLGKEELKECVECGEPTTNMLCRACQIQSQTEQANTSYTTGALSD
jgi:uncharacterized protein (TIGR00269 family)